MIHIHTATYPDRAETHIKGKWYRSEADDMRTAMIGLGRQLLEAGFKPEEVVRQWHIGVGQGELARLAAMVDGSMPLVELPKPVPKICRTCRLWKRFNYRNAGRCKRHQPRPEGVTGPDFSCAAWRGFMKKGSLE